MFSNQNSGLDLVTIIIFLRTDKSICRMAEALCSYIEQDRPFLGICLGLQLLFESSEENGPGKTAESFSFPGLTRF